MNNKDVIFYYDISKELETLSLWQLERLCEETGGELDIARKALVIVRVSFNA